MEDEIKCVLYLMIEYAQVCDDVPAIFRPCFPFGTFSSTSMQPLEGMRTCVYMELRLQAFHLE